MVNNNIFHEQQYSYEMHETTTCEVQVDTSVNVDMSNNAEVEIVETTH